MELILAVILAAVALNLVRNVLREHVRAVNWEPPTHAAVRLQGARWCEFEIVGESHHQRVLAAIAGVDPDGVKHHCEAVLIPEPGNPDDPNAVLVAIDGRRVGYLTREDAALYGEWMTELGIDAMTASCPAFICGGFVDEEGRQAPYGVKLGLAWPPELEGPKEHGPAIELGQLARLRGQALSEEEAWHSPPVPIDDDDDLARAFAGGIAGRTIVFAGWSEERLPYLQAVSRAAGLLVADPMAANLDLLCVGPRAHAYHVAPARAKGAAVVSGEQLQGLMERTLAASA